MESEEVLKSLTVMDASASSCNGESPQISNGVMESEHSGVEFLEDLDSYLEDINDRLIISRTVSDSVIRGMVNAVEQEAAEKIAQKELEVARLKATLRLYHVGMHYEPKSTEHGMYATFSDALVEHDRMSESIESLRNAAKEQLKKLKKDIDRVRGSTSIRRISSGSELGGLGLGGILQEKASDKWMDVDKTFDSLRITQESIYREVDDMVFLSKASLCQWQLEREFQGEIEDMVIMNCIRSLQQEFEEKLWDQNTLFYGHEGVNWVEKIKAISGLRQDLDVISKSVSVPELGQLASQGSVENGDELSNSKRTDPLHRKVSGNHVSSETSLWEGNGKHEESVITTPENLDAGQLKHMSKDELVNYFKNEMTKMKRNHDYKVQGMTEEIFILKREYLRERRGSSLPLRKDKEFEILRKKIPEVIRKLDDILVENEKLPGLNDNAENIGSLKDRVDSLLSDNRQLRDLLAERKKEVSRLSLQVSDAALKMSQHSLAEANSLKIIENLECAIEDAHIEASISEDVYKYLLREMTGQMNCLTEESNMHCNIMQGIYEIIFRDAAQNAAPTSEDTSKCKYEDSDMESIIMQGLCGVIFKEAFEEAAEKFSNENELRVSLERKAMENESALLLEVAEKERKNQETLLLAESMKKNEKLVQETAAALAKEKEQLELASQELNVLRDQTSRQQISLLESNTETIVMKGMLVEALEQIESYRVEIHELKQKLELTKKELSEADSEKRMLLAATEEKQNKLSLVEEKEREHRKQMESIMVLVHILPKAVDDFECRVAEDINLRLEKLSSLIQKANILKRTGLLYKQKLERRCSDLQKAEAEVDLLGDEVDTLLSLLEKIYIALDHYSPILQHYPGIIEILKLVRRELSGESFKKV